MGTYALMSAVTFVADQGFKAQWRIVDYIPAWSVPTWLAIGFALLFWLAIAGSLEATTTSRATHENELKMARDEAEKSRRQVDCLQQVHKSEISAIQRDFDLWVLRRNLMGPAF